jgi:hypothetical protein
MIVVEIVVKTVINIAKAVASMKDAATRRIYTIFFPLYNYPRQSHERKQY